MRMKPFSVEFGIFANNHHLPMVPCDGHTKLTVISSDIFVHMPTFLIITKEN